MTGDDGSPVGLATTARYLGHMSDPVKHHYVIELGDSPGATPWLDFEVDLRLATTADTDDLTELMLDAYRGTVDYDDESLEDARVEMSDYFDGSPLLDHSFVATVDGTIVGAILLSEWRGKPLIGYVMTRPEYKNQGLGSLLLRASLRALRGEGKERVHAFITEGNTASEALFRGAGAVRVTD